MAVNRRSARESGGSELLNDLMRARSSKTPPHHQLSLVALGKVVRAMGVTEFPAKVHMAGPNVPRAINTAAPQPDAGHAQSVPATVEAYAYPARAVELDSLVPA